MKLIRVPELAEIEINDNGVVRVWLDEQFDGKVDFTSHDIDDLLRDWKPGDVYYDSTDDSFESRRRITVLLEALTEEGRPEVSKDARMRLQQLLPGVSLKRFERPQSSLSWRICSKLMPRAPKMHVTYSFGELKERYRWWHYAAAIPMMLGVFILIWLQAWLIGEWMLLNPVTAATTLGSKIASWGSGVAIVLLLALSFLDNKFGKRVQSPSFSPYTMGFFNKAAINEEQTFREGAENWNRWERIRSCVLFGLIHQPSLIYVFGMIIPHILMGGVFMWIYLRTFHSTGRRRTAVLAASVLHRLFNRIALFVMVISMVAHLSGFAWNSVSTLIGGIAFVWGAMMVENRRNR